MNRPSYLRQIAVPARAAAGVATLAPPRLLFRPSPARWEFTVIENRATDPQTPHRTAMRPDMRFAALPTREPAPTLPEMPAGLIRPPSLPLPPAAREIAAAAAGPGQSAFDPRSPPANPVPPATERPDEHARRAAQAPQRETQRASPTKPTASLHSVPAPEWPQGLPPSTPDRRASATLAARAQLETPAVRPAIQPLVPPTRVPRTPTAERASPGVRIGTLEIRVVAPAAAPVQPPTSPADRHAPTPTHNVTGVNRLTRGFGAFGLNQA